MASTFICFSYPTLLRENLVTNDIYPPEPLITNIDTKTRYTLIITAAICLAEDIITTAEIDILFNNKSIIHENNDIPGKCENFYIKKSSMGETIYISSMFVNNIKFTHSGVHSIIVKIYKNDSERNKEMELLDVNHSKFMVSISHGDD